MTSKVYRYTIQLDATGGCSWEPTGTVRIDEEPPAVVTLHPYQPIYDQLQHVRRSWTSAEYMDRLILLEDLFDLLIGTPQFLVDNPPVTKEVIQICMNLGKDRASLPIRDKINVMFLVAFGLAKN
jgi:hypothetical protein